MNVLVVGCGYVGTALALALRRAGHEVTAVRRSTGGGDELRAAGVSLWNLDILEPGALRGRVRGFDSVVQLVSSARGGLEAFRAVHTSGLRQVLEALAECPPSRLVLASSTSVYRQTDGSWVSEMSSTGNATERSELLLAAEARVRETVSAWERAWVILRIAGIYGPGRGWHLDTFEAGVAGRGLEDERWRNWIHRDDLVAAIVAVLSPEVPSGIYNVVDHEPVRLGTMIEWFARELGRPCPESGPVDGPRAGGRGATDKRVSNDRILRATGLRLMYPTFREGFAARIESIRANAERQVSQPGNRRAASGG